MSFEINYYAVDGRHITLKSNGSIEIYLESPKLLIMEDDIQIKPIIIEYEQTKILKDMILAEAKLDKYK